MLPAIATLFDEVRRLRATGTVIQPDDPIVVQVEESIDKIVTLSGNHANLEEISTQFEEAFGFYRPSLGFARDRVFDAVVPDGWFRDYLDWARQGKSTPQFYFGAAFAMIAAAMGRRPRIHWSVSDLYPNAYVLLVGGTGAGKGSAFHVAKSVVGPALGPPIVASEGTPAGIAKALEKRYIDTGLEASGLILAPELRSLISKDDKNKADLVTWLTDWWDCHEYWPRALVGDPDFALHNLAVSILGASNMAWLRKLPSDAIQGGFLPRWLIFETLEQDERWGTALPDFDEAERARLIQRLQNVTASLPMTIGFDGESREYLRAWYEHDLFQQNRRAEDEVFRYWLMRKQAHMMKAALIWQFVDDGPRDLIRIRWVRRARNLVDWCDASVLNVYRRLGMTQDGETSQMILDFIARKGRASEREIKRGLRNKLRAPIVSATLKALRDMGEIRVIETTPRHGTVWGLTG